MKLYRQLLLAMTLTAAMLGINTAYAGFFRDCTTYRVNGVRYKICDRRWHPGPRWRHHHRWRHRGRHFQRCRTHVNRHGRVVTRCRSRW